jgi:hypothetical protein
LDGTLDDIADLPEFKPFPSGAFKVKLPKGFVAKKIGTHPAIEMKMELLEILELADPSDEAPKVGAEASIAFMMDNDTGAGFFKLAATPIAERLRTRNRKEVMEGAKEMECIVVLTKTHDKEKDRYYNNLKKLDVV